MSVFGHMVASSEYNHPNTSVDSFSKLSSLKFLVIVHLLSENESAITAILQFLEVTISSYH